MQYLLAFALLLFLSHSADAQIKFKPYDDAAKAEAKANNQLIFIEFTAGWCPPCKMMKSNVFSDKKVGDFYSNNFVCTQVDVDKQGSLASRYNAGSIPNFVFVDDQGEVVHRGLGYQGVEPFIALGKEALRQAEKSAPNTPNNNTLPQPGKTQQPKGSAAALADCLEKAGDCETEVQNFIQEKNWNDSEEHLQLIVEAATNGSEKALAHYKKHKEQFARELHLFQLEAQIFEPVMERALLSIDLEEEQIDWPTIDATFEAYFPKISAYRYQQIVRALVYTQFQRVDDALEACDRVLSKKGLAGLDKKSQSEIYQNMIEISSTIIESSDAVANGAVPQEYLHLLYNWLKGWEKVDANKDVYGLLAIVCAELGKEEEAEKYSSYLD